MAPEVVLRRRGWRAASAIVVFSLLPAFAGSKGAYHGTVVDSRTKEPLEGAVVAVLWTKSPILRMDGPQYHQKAIEVVTGPDGKFSVPNDPGSDWNPFTVINDLPWIIVFKPGYGPFPWRHTAPKYARNPDTGIRYRLSNEKIWQAFLDGTVVELPKLHSEKELRRFASLSGLGGIGPDVPESDILNIVRLVNVHRQMLGLQPIRQ